MRGTTIFFDLETGGVELPRDLLVSRMEGRWRTNGGCWLWTGARIRSGYGHLKIPGTRHNVYAHRLSYLLHVGPLSRTQVVDHVRARGCASRLCINPAHLEAVSVDENNRRADSPPAVNGRKTHCIRGHELAGDNLDTMAYGRRCRTCRRLRASGRAGIPAQGAEHEALADVRLTLRLAECLARAV